MHVIKRKTLIEFYEQPGCQDAKGPLEAWYYEADHAQWASPSEIKSQYSSASILKNNRVIFNIAGNKYRLITSIHFNRGKVYVRHVLTHTEYDRGDWKK